MKKFTILFVICLFLFTNQINAQIFTTYDTLDGLASNYVYAIAIDAEGNKWFGCGGTPSVSGGVDAGKGGVSKLFAEGTTISPSVTPSNQNVGFQAGNTEFNVTSNALWKISNDADWLTLSRTSLGVNATIIANFTANTSSSPRVANIIIYGPGLNTQYVTVTQSGIIETVSSIYGSKVTVYPNPAKDITIFKIENNNNRKIYLEIFDFSGRLIGEKTSTDERIEFDFSNYSSRIYFYKLRNSEGIIGAGKIVRE